MTKLQKLIGCHPALTSNKWGHFDHMKPMEHIRYVLCNRLQRIQDMPRHYRWELANLLSKMAHRLRGGESRDLGWDCYGNLAASLQDDLVMKLCVGEPVTLERDEADDMIHSVDKLARLARATHWHDYERAETEQ